MIGIFDSGFGGLTVLKELLNIMPEYDYLYLGDQARYPYGPRSLETIREFSDKNIQFLIKNKAKIILIACNSASAASLNYLQNKYPDKHILGVIIPATEEAVKTSRFGRIGLVATNATINSKAYEKEIKKSVQKFYRPQHKKALSEIKIFSKACPLLVPLVEENWAKKPETKMIMKKYLRSLKNQNIDTLILGCTHYPLLEKQFNKIMGKNCNIINAPRTQAIALKRYLDQHPDLKKQLTKNSKQLFYTTDCPDKFQSMGSLFLGQNINSTKKIAIN